MLVPVLVCGAQLFLRARAVTVAAWFALVLTRAYSS